VYSLFNYIKKTGLNQFLNMTPERLGRHCGSSRQKLDTRGQHQHYRVEWKKLFFKIEKSVVPKFC